MYIELSTSRASLDVSSMNWSSYNTKNTYILIFKHRDTFRHHKLCGSDFLKTPLLKVWVSILAYSSLLCSLDESKRPGEEEVLESGG